MSSNIIRIEAIGPRKEANRQCDLKSWDVYLEELTVSEPSRLNMENAIIMTVVIMMPVLPENICTV